MKHTMTTNFLHITRHTTLERPEPVLQLLLCGTLCVALLVALGAAMAGSKNLEIPLLVASICLVAIGVTVNKKTAVVVLSIFVVGYLVVPQNYLLRIAHMITSPDTPLIEYTDDREAIQEGINVSRLVDSAVKITRSRSSDDIDDTREQLNEIVIGELARVVQNEGADYPLQRIVDGESEELADQYEFADFFTTDMHFLRTQGLIRYRNSRFNEARPTELGSQVTTYIRESTRRDRPVFDFDESSAVDRPTDEEIQDITGAVPISSSFPGDGGANWYRFSAPESDFYQISANSENGDPVIRLYDAPGFGLIDEDDDGGPNLNSLIERDLSPGDYYLAVHNFGWPSTAEYSISVVNTSD